ncbi:MAG: hypothetical protein JWO30_205 [Fibrobacteres bacterium]|nr:hypothetical protein [Fibrobacterota bacterium]
MPSYYKPFQGWRTVYPVAPTSVSRLEILRQPSQIAQIRTSTIQWVFTTRCTLTGGLGFYRKRPLLPQIDLDSRSRKRDFSGWEPGLPPEPRLTVETMAVFWVSTRKSIGNRKETLMDAGASVTSMTLGSRCDNVRNPIRFATSPKSAHTQAQLRAYSHGVSKRSIRKELIFDNYYSVVTFRYEAERIHLPPKVRFPMQREPSNKPWSLERTC